MSQTRSESLVLFFVLTYALMWIAFISVAAFGVFGLHASLISWISVTLLWVCATYFLATMPRQIPLPDRSNPPH